MKTPIGCQTGGTPWRRSAKWRSLWRARSRRRIRSSRKACGWTMASITSSDASRSRSTSVLVDRALLGDERGALVRVLDGGDLVGVHGVDGGLRAHHGDAGGRQGDRGIGRERRPGHRVEAGAVGLADDHRDLRHGRLAHRRHHLRPVTDDALALDGRADHEPGHVGQEDQREVEGVAQPDEAGRLVGGVDEQGAGEMGRVVGDDADRMPVETAEPDDQLAGEAAA